MLGTVSGVHRYQVTCSWAGSTGVGYDGYDRSHDVRSPPATTVMRVSADPAFRGDPSLQNPEQLVVMAAASCQLLTFLAIAARARIDIVAYEDHAEGLMPEGDLPVRLTRIELRPTITIASSTPAEQIVRLVELAHRDCYIANSLRTDIVVTPTIVTAD